MKSLHFLYHELRPAKSRYSYVTPCDEFEAHCRFFAQKQKVEDQAHLRPEITFDDGHQSDLAFALPVLERHELRATFFITAGWTDRRPGYMSGEHLRALHAAGHVIGAHGMEHKLLTQCSEAELDEELRGARERLQDTLGASVQSMSLPGGRANSRVLDGCFRAGYTQVFTSVPRAESMEQAPRTVGRLNLLGGSHVDWLAQVLDPQSGVLARLERKARLKDTAKRVLGDTLYARLWAIGNHQEPESAEAEVPAL